MTRGGVLLRRRDEVRAEVPARPSRPGWAFAANLMPPERILAYRLRRLRERIVLAVCVVVFLSAAGFAYGFWQVHRTGGALQDAQARGAALQQQATQYVAVTRVKGSVAQVRARLATLLGDDVDVAALIGAIGAAAPADVHLTSLAVTVDGPAGQAGGTGRTGSGRAPGSLDTSGAQHIGTVEIDATGARIDDAAAFADALGRLPGIVDVLPTDNSAQDATGTKLHVTLALTDELFTHRFDPNPPDGGDK